MPFRSLYREQMTPAEYQTPGALCIVHPEYEEQDHRSASYPHMDFTYPDHQHATPLTTPRLPKYSTAMEMDDDDDDLSYLRQGRLGYLADAASASTNAGLSAASLSYDEMLDVGRDHSSVPSVRTDSMADSSTSELSLNQIATSPGDKICPLITGDSEACHPDRCGPDAPCVNFTHFSSVETCGEIPCLAAPRTENTSIGSSNSAASRLTRPFPVKRSSSDPHTSKPPGKAEAKRRAKQAHSLVEKKYRENLNAKLGQLHETLKTTRYGPKKSRENENEDSDEFTANAACGSVKFRKGDVLDDALDYVNQTEVEMRHMENEIQRLMNMVWMMERRLKFETARSSRGSMALPTQGIPG